MKADHRPRIDTSADHTHASGWWQH